MTLENTIENKQKFFGSYWGNRYRYSNEFGTYNGKWDMHLPNHIKNDSCHLLLRPLFSITDEEAHMVANISTTHDNQTEDIKNIGCITSGKDKEKILVRRGGAYVHLYFDGKILLTNSISIPASYAPVLNVAYIIDYLRSRGFLLPFMGLSCEEIIERGWAKYSEQ